MASLPPLLPTAPASIKLQDTDAVEFPSPKRRRLLEPDAFGSRAREPNSPPSSRLREGRSPPSKVRRRSRSPLPSTVRPRSRMPPRRRSRSPSPYKVRRRSRSPPQSRVWRQSSSSSPSRVRRRSRSQSPSRVQRRSRSPSQSRVRRRSRSPLPSRFRRRSRSPSPSRFRHRSRSSSPSRFRRRSRSPSPSRVWRQSRSPSPSRLRRRSRSPSRVWRRSRSPSPSRLRRRSRSPSRVWRLSRSPSPSRLKRRSRSPSRVWRRSRSPPPSRVRHRLRSPPYLSRLPELKRGTWPSAEAAVEGERASPSSTDDSSMENRPSHIHNNCKAPSRNARRKKIKRQRRAEAKKETGEAPGGNDRRKRMKRGIWAEAKKEFREMKRDKLFENIKKLQSCIWLLEKDGADMAEIMEFRSLLETTKKQYVENEAQLTKEGSSAPLQVLKRDRLEKMVERDEQNMDSEKVEGSDAVSERNKLAEEVNHLKSELEKVRENRDYQLTQAQSLMADVAKQKEIARRYGVELEDTMRRVASLEEGCLLRREIIKALQIQLASANENLTVP